MTVPSLSTTSFAGSIMLIAVVAGGTARADDEVLDRIWDAFRARQEQATSARITLRRRPWMSNVSIANFDAGMAPSANEIPSGGRWLDEMSASLWISGARVRFESDMPSFAGSDNGLTVPSISAYDGTAQQFFTDFTGHTVHQNKGSIRDLEAFDEWGNYEISPLFYAIRPLRPECFGSDPANWHVDSRPVVVDGRECVAIWSQPPDQPPDLAALAYTLRAILDPERDYSVLRFWTEQRGQLSMNQEVSYERTLEPRWVPSEWTSTWYIARTQEVRSMAEVHLESIELDIAIPDERFHIEFPPGTRVTDHNRDEAEFIVQTNGSWRRFDPPSTRAVSSRALWWSNRWLQITVGACLLMGGVLVLRRWRRGY